MMNKEQVKEGELRQLSERSGGGVLHVPYPSTDSDDRYCFGVLESGVTGFGIVPSFRVFPHHLN